jgi:uncharacterized radical SAM superfamily Fe-S cluster-containing enzyme
MLQSTSESLLKRTVSRCPACHQSAPAEVWRRNENGKQTVWLRRRCAEHGAVEVCISSDARFYWVAQGSPENRCACKSVGDGGYEGTLGTNALREDASECETLSTCLALIEIVNSCNLACPTCYADSPHSTRVDAVPLNDLQRRIQGVIDRKGRIEILQLSGGEPTLHPQFFELLTWCHANPGLDYVLLNTNGVRIATDDAFADQLGKTFRYGKFQLYLQFDGPQLTAQHALRGADLRKVREKTIERCGQLGIPVTLAMTVTPENLPHLWDSIEYGLRWPHVRGISFQPMFTSGRNEVIKLSGYQVAGGECSASARLNTADIILGAVEQSGGVLKFEDFTPLPCGDPNCATIGYLLRTPAGLRSISDFVDFSQVQGFLRDKVRYSLDDLAQCGCESQPLGRLLHDFELNEQSTFRLFIKPFMDVWTWDEDRIDRCCTHVIRPDGTLDSFCRYYANAQPEP